MIRAWAAGQEAQLVAMEAATVALLRRAVKAWNAGDAAALGGLFAPEGQWVGHEGAVAEGPEAIAARLGADFGGALSPFLVAKVQRLSALGPEAALLRAQLAWVLRGEAFVRPERVGLLSLVAVRHEATWRLAQWHASHLDALREATRCQELVRDLQAQWEADAEGA